MKPFAPTYFLLLGGLLPFIAHAAPAPETPTLQTIIDKTLTQDSLRQQALQSMQYDQLADDEQLDGNGKVTRHDTLQMIISPGLNPPWQVVSMRNADGTLNPDRADAQDKGADVEGNKETFTLRDLVDRFTVTWAGTDVIDGQPAYELAFAPKPNQPYRDDIQKVVNQLQGHIWISTRTYTVLQTEASLVGPVTVAWFFARVPTLDFHYRTHDSDDGFAPAQVQVTLEVDAPFVGYHEHQTVDISHFRARSPVGATTPPAP